MPVPEESTDLFYDQFPSSFMWGSTSSATQVDGALNIDGRKMSWWDPSSLRKSSQDIMDPHTIRNDSCDEPSCHKFAEDVSLLKEMNATCYKFSLNWSRLMDGTTNKVNKAGVQYYNDLINTLLENGIEPIVVLYHWDPQELFENHPFNWMDERVIRAFGSYAHFCFKKFGDRVQKWVPIQDPWKHSVGSGNELSNNGGTPFKVLKNLLKAHTLAYRIYEKEFRTKQEGSVGISVNCKCMSSSVRNCLRNEIAIPDYAAYSELRPSFNPNASPDYDIQCWEELKNVPSDFVDLINEDFYSELTMAETRSSTGGLLKRNSLPILSNTRMILNKIKNDLQNPEILLCGKGYPLLGTEMTSLVDLMATQYFKTYASEILKAIVLDGCNVIGFLPGTLVDSWEWDGLTLSYGLQQLRLENPLKFKIQRISSKYINKFFKNWDVGFIQVN